MSSLIGSVDHFVHGSGFSKYMERMNILFALNSIPEGTKKNLFITLSGPVIFDEIKLIYPETEIDDIDYNQMIAKLKERLDKTQPNMMYRHKFNNRVQGVDEPAENYVLALKLLASQCGFGTHKNEAVKDRIVFGLRDQDLKHKLLMKDNMTLDEVEDMVVRTELAKLRTKDLEQQNTEYRSVNSVKYRLGYGEQQDGWSRDSRPNFRGHNRQYDSRGRSTSRERGRVTPYYNRYDYRTYESRPKTTYQGRRGYTPGNHESVICNYCKKRGHVKRNCPKLQNRRTVNFVDEESVDSYDFKRLRLKDSEDEDEDYP